MPVRLCPPCHRLYGPPDEVEAVSACVVCGSPLRALTSAEAAALVGELQIEHPLPALREGESTNRAAVPADPYQLPSLAQVQAYLARHTLESAPGQVRSQVFVWGYGVPPEELLEEEFMATPAAHAFAAGCGWEEYRPGAWAKEKSTPLPLSHCLGELEQTLRLAPTVAGWGGRMGPAVCQLDESIG